MSFIVARRAGAGVEGWLKTVRLAVGTPVAEVAGRIGVAESGIYRWEQQERRGAIELKTLRRAAEALGCELVYGLAPRLTFRRS